MIVNYCLLTRCVLQGAGYFLWRLILAILEAEGFFFPNLKFTSQRSSFLNYNFREKMDHATVLLSSVSAMLSKDSLFVLSLIWVVYRIGRLLYNISPFHPLYGFPGPKLAAMSFLYEAYYDWILTGRYGHEIKRMHAIYGESWR